MSIPCFGAAGSPKQSGADPQPCLVKVQADHGWTLTHVWYFGKRWQFQACTCESAGQHPACSGTHPPSVSPAGTVRAHSGHGWAVSKCDHTLFIFLVSVPRDLSVT